LFILDPETIKFLDKNNFFENLPLYSNHGGTYTLSNILNFTKEDLLSVQRKNYEEYQRDPYSYQKKINESTAEYYRKKEEQKAAEEEFIPDYSNVDFDNIRDVDSPLNSSVNPWMDCLSDDEATTAYWNTD